MTRARPAARAFAFALPLIAVAIAGVAPAQAGDVTVTVVDVAGDIAYVTPGGDAGVVAGAHVRIAGGELVVIAVAAGSAAVRLDGAIVTIGASGVVAAVPPSARGAVAARAPVRPLDAWREQWPPAAMPAADQHPAAVPLGAGGSIGRAHVAVTVHGGAVVDRSGARASEVEARAALSVEPWREHPLGIDLDVAGRLFGINSAGARTPVVVRRADVRWGPAGDPRLAAGRLAWAAESIGLLDGVRVAARRGALELAGFGGLVPDPIDTRPDTRATRFGAEAIWDAPAARWRPRLALTAVGSTWNGALDERRVMASAEAGGDSIDVTGWGEAQGFAGGNPWGAPAVQVTGAGAGVAWHRRGARASLDASFERPERSARLAAALPSSWLCWQAPAADEASAPCAGSDWWGDLAASGGVAGRRWSLDGTATLGTSHGDGRFVDASALVLGELRILPRGLRLQLGGSGGRARFLDWYGVEVGLALPATRRWQLSARWRPELVAYAGALDRFVSHSAIVESRWTLARTLDLAASALATTGEDRDAVALFTTLAWRPLP